ncbi:MAG: hypothetical protein ABFD89_29310 [Bryobacteraceae bacterium]
MPRVTPRVPHQTPMYEPDGKMSRTWVIFFEKLARFDPGDTNRKATFVLKRALTVENDLTNHYIVRVAGAFYDAALKAKLAPTGAAARFVIERSTDEGLTWESILNPNPGYLEIPDGDDSLIVYDRGIFHPDPAIARVEIGYLLRKNCTQIGSTTAGQDITSVVRWE